MRIGMEIITLDLYHRAVFKMGTGKGIDKEKGSDPGRSQKHQAYIWTIRGRGVMKGIAGKLFRKQEEPSKNVEHG